MGLLRSWWIVLVCAAALAVAFTGYLRQWGYSEVPAPAAFTGIAYPVTIQEFEAGSPQTLAFILESWAPGRTLTLVDAAGSPYTVTLVLRQGTLPLVLTGLSGLVFLAVAIIFFAPRYSRHGIGEFFWISILYGTSIMLGGVFFPRTGSLLVMVFNLIQLFCLAFLPAVFVRLALVFPLRSKVLDRRWLQPALFLLAGAVVAWQAIVNFRYVTDPGPAREGPLVAAHTAADLFMVVLTLTGVVIFAVRGRRLELTRERHQVGWLLWGFAIGAAPYVFLRTLPSLVGLPPMLPHYADRFIELAIPLSFVMAVVRHQFLDIDVIIRRSLLYGLLAGSLVAVYLGAGIVFGRLVGEIEGLDPWILPIAVGLLAGISFRPLRRALGSWIDRTFFKLAHDHDLTLDRLDLALARMADPSGVARILGEEVDTALWPDTMAILLRDGDSFVVDGDLDPEWGRWILRELEADRPSVLAAHRSTSMPEIEGDLMPLDLLEEGFVLVQAMETEGTVEGAILLGPRRTERRYVEQDIAFLAAAARVTARHIERIALMQTVATETLARRRLAELDRLKSEFLAQVAHDLRTPVAGITWSARNLLDGLAGDLNDGQAKYMGSISSSGAHLNRLVDNLLEISRLEDARNQFINGPVTAHEAWREALENLRPLAAAKNVTLEMTGEDHAVPVTGNHDKLVEVTVNLLDNAVKYTESETTVTITVHPAVDGFQAIDVRDRGPGLRGQDPEALFGRFAQGDPSPHSSRKGFGLGLHIAATYLELMGGSLSAADHPDGGAVFACRLPLADVSIDHPGQGDPS